MSTVLIPANLDYVPFNDTDLFYIRVCITPENWHSFDKNPELLNHIRLNYFTGCNSSYPRFDPASWPYKLHPCPEHKLISLTDRPTFSDFETITTIRVQELKLLAENYNEIYFFYSGGIDATTVLCSMLINWDKVTLSKLRVVMNQYSIDENPMMFRDHIEGKFAIIPIEDFYSRKIVFSNDAIYTGGMCADKIFGYDGVIEFDTRYPDKYQKPWRLNRDTIIDHFSSLSKSRDSGIFAYETVAESIERFLPESESIFDFLSWISFNWGYNNGVYSMAWALGHLPNEIDSKKWLSENCFIFFNSEEYQYWHLGTIDSPERMGSNAKMHKYAAKKYIYDFNKDIDYFLNKNKEKSLPRNPEHNSMYRFYAVDTNYTFYYQQSPVTPW